MPKTRTFGRWRAFSSDDLTVAYALEVLAYVTWIIWATWIMHSTSNHHLMNWLLVRHFYGVSVTLIGCALFLSVCVIHVSLQGTIINAHPRRHMPTFLALKLAVDVVTAIVLSIMTWQVYFLSPDVYLNAVWLSIKGLWIIVASVMFGTWHKVLPVHITFVKAIVNDRGENTQVASGKSEVARSVQNWLYSHVQRYFGADNEPALTEVSDMFSSFFKEDIGAVPTDILASMILLEHDQLCRKPLLEGNTVSKSRRCVPQPWMSVENAINYLPFAIAAFGWPMFVTHHSLRETFRVLQQSRKFINDKKNTKVIVEDPWLINTAVICKLTGLAEENLVHVSYHNSVFKVPFFIALDHTNKAVVISLRGTGSPMDVVTDLTASSCEQEMNISGFSNISIHRGMYLTAQNVVNMLLGVNSTNENEEKSTGLLVVAHQQLKDQVGIDQAAKYKLVITGHSLGAGVASCVALLLRQHDDFKDLQCFAFSPPGGLMSLSAATYCEQFVMSVILGDDIVGRIGVFTGLDLKIKILTLLKSCDMPKSAIFGGWLLRLVSRLFGARHLSDYRWSWNVPTWSNNPPAEQSVREFQAKIEAEVEYSQQLRDSSSRMYPPGCILFITETFHGSLFNGKSTFSSQLLDCDDDRFQEIMISENMLRHHVPWLLLTALENLSSN